MMRRGLSIAALLACLGCAAQHAERGSDSILESPAAELAREYAPDLFEQAKSAWARAEEDLRRADEQIADDRRTEARLWLAAAATEADRVQLERRRAELQLEEERWGRQLARDQDASALVAHDIAVYQARIVALREAERVAALGQSPRVDEATLDAVLTRVRLNLALAEALGATEAELEPVRKRADLIGRRSSGSARAAEALLLKSEALIGRTRSQWPRPRPGASTELLETALATGFSADRISTGVVIRSERFFKSGGQVSSATVQRFLGLLEAFPHGPVACQVAVPELRSRAWSRRVALLLQRLRRTEDPARVSTSMVETRSLSAGTVQCTFAAYRTP